MTRVKSDFFFVSIVIDAFSEELQNHCQKNHKKKKNGKNKTKKRKRVNLYFCILLSHVSFPFFFPSHYLSFSMPHFFSFPLRTMLWKGNDVYSIRNTLS